MQNNSVFKCLIAIGVFCTIFSACQKEEISNRPFPRVNSLNPDIIDNKLILKGDIFYTNEQQIVNQGFVLESKVFPYNINDSTIYNLGVVTNKGIFSKEIELSILKNDLKYYVKAFIKTNDFLVYGVERTIIHPISKWELINLKIDISFINSKAFSIDNKVYVLLSAKYNSSKVYEFDPYAGSLTQKKEFPGKFRNGSSLFIINNQLFLGCGQNENNLYLNDFWKYNPTIDEWVNINFTGNARTLAFGFSIGDYGYFGGGSAYSSKYNDFYAYDINTNVWTKKNDLPFSGTVYASFSYNNNGYVLIPANDSKIQLWCFNPLTDNWIKVDELPEYFKSSLVVEINGVAYFYVNYANNNIIYSYDISSRNFNFFGVKPVRRLGNIFLKFGNKAIFGFGTSGKELFDVWMFDPTI